MKKMKNKLKKGFTIVELVIVIAVIAILAAVLIPTFSSITNSARESAALQEAKSGSETILALTTGTLPENSAFLVADDEESDTNDYTFVFAGQKIQNVNAVSDFDSVLNKCKRNDVMTSGSATEGYIVYVSTKALDVNEEEQVIAGKINQHVANRILSAIGVTATVTDGTDNNYTVSASRDYAMWNFQEGDKTYYFNIYWTSDFNPTLIAFMGGNVTGTVTPPAAPETVMLTYTDNSTKNITATVNGTPYSAAVEVEKGKAVTIVLSGTVEVGKITIEVGGTPINQPGGDQPGDWTYDAGSKTITIPAEKVTGDISVSIAL